MSIEDDDLECVVQFRTTMVDAVNRLSRVAEKCHSRAGNLARLEAERLWQQTRANTEAVRAVEAEEEVERLLQMLAVVRIQCIQNNYWHLSCSDAIDSVLGLKGKTWVELS